MLAKFFTHLSLLFLCSFLLSSCSEQRLEQQSTLSPTVKVKMVTSKGTIVLELDRNRAPDTVANFLRYVDSGLYDGTIFHRVIPGFMIQGGGFKPGINKQSTYPPIINEADNGLKNLTGTIAMARTANPHSATSQFFINTANNTSLDHSSKSERGWGYAVFGRVIEGMDVVKAIESVATTSYEIYNDVPVTDIVIEKVTLIQ